MNNNIEIINFTQDLKEPIKTLYFYNSLFRSIQRCIAILQME